MQSQKTWKTRSMTGTAMFDGICGFVGAVCHRLTTTWQLRRESQNRPADNTLCYRGIRNSQAISNLGPNRNSQSHRFDTSLCYRGVRASFPVSNMVPSFESQSQHVDATLCYRGTHYTNQHTVSA